MAWFVKILSAALPYLIKYGPDVVDLAERLLELLRSRQADAASRGAVTTPEVNRKELQLDHLASAIEHNLNMQQSA